VLFKSKTDINWMKIDESEKENSNAISDESFMEQVGINSGWNLFYFFLKN